MDFQKQKNSTKNNTYSLRLQISATSGSMQPIIAPKAYVIINVSPRQRYTIGDVVAYIGPGGTIVVHRIVLSESKGLNRQQFILRGDKNRRTDRPVVTAQIIGKVLGVNCEKYFIDFTAPISVRIGHYISFCGRTITAHHELYFVGSLIINLLSHINIWYFKRTNLYHSQ